MTTTMFASLTATVASQLGLPQARVVVVDHPLGGTDRATIERWADGAVERAMALLTGRG